MSRERAASASIAFLILIVSADSVRAQGAGAPVRPPDPANDCTNVIFGGTVTEITKRSISIQWPGDAKAKRFAVSETLAAGQVPLKPRVIASSGKRILGGYHVLPSNMYRLADVKVGDVVSIGYSHLGGEDICDHIRIHKRPGGSVPPLPEEAEKLRNPAEVVKSKLPPGSWRPDPNWQYIPYHEEMNARWDLEDKGIPYPEKFGKNRRFPVAPMPRSRITTPAIDS